MVPQRKYTIPELLDLADRMISRGTSDSLNSNLQLLRRDCLSCGMILAHLLLKSVIEEAIILSGDDGSPPTVPDQTPFQA
jgi:hypothetical protein